MNFRNEKKKIIIAEFMTCIFEISYDESDRWSAYICAVRIEPGRRAITCKSSIKQTQLNIKYFI